jgi:hypothetical protein
MPATHDSYERELARSVDAEMEPCPACEARGLRDGCVFCGGSGYIEHDAMGDECPDCKGTGVECSYLDNITGIQMSCICDSCGGTGRVEHDAMDDADALYERAGDR